MSISTASAIDIRLSPLQHAFVDHVQVQPTPGIVQQHFQSLQQQQQQQAAQVAAVAPSANPQPAEQAATRESNMQGDGQAQAFQ